MYMNGCSHLKKNKENKNRYHVMVLILGCHLAQSHVLKKYRYPENTAGTMAAIFGDQFR